MTIKAHFDGKVFVPDEPVEIPAGSEVTLDVARPAPVGSTAQDILDALKASPGIKEIWDRIAAGRDSVEVARDLRRQASTRRPAE
jgi:hypothetical protein